MGRYSQLYSAKMKNKILLVEDELDMSLIVADTLCAEGYDVQSPRANAILAKMFEKLGHWSREF